MLVVVHSNLRFDAQPLPAGLEYLCCIVKDSQQKAFFIRIVDPEVRVDGKWCHITALPCAILG